MRIPVYLGTSTFGSTIDPMVNEDLQALVAAANVLGQKFPFEDEPSFQDFLRQAEEAPVVWEQNGIDPNQLQRAIAYANSNVEVRQQFVKQSNAGDGVVVPPVDDNTPAEEGGKSNLGLLIGFLILAGLIFMYSSSKKPKGLSGTEDNLVKFDPGPIPAVLNGPKTKRPKHKKTISIQI